MLIFSQGARFMCAHVFLRFVFLPCILKISSFQKSEMNSVITSCRLNNYWHFVTFASLGRCVSLLWLVGLSVCLCLSPCQSVLVSNHSWLILVSLSFLSWSLLLFFYFPNHLKANTLLHFTPKCWNMYLLKNRHSYISLPIYLSHLRKLINPQYCIYSLFKLLIVPQIYFIYTLFSPD